MATSENDDVSKLRRTYGRGFHDGIKHIQEAMNMTPAKVALVERSLTSTAKKVLDAVPMDCAHDLHEIIADIGKQGVHMDHSLALGCLNSLIDSKLVKEIAKRRYIRVAVRTPEPAADNLKLVPSTSPSLPAPPPLPAATAAPPAPSTPVLANEPNPMDRLAKLASEMRALAAEIEEAALDVEATIQSLNNKCSKYRQLQALLKED